MNFRPSGRYIFTTMSPTSVSGTPEVRPKGGRNRPFVHAISYPFRYNSHPTTPVYTPSGIV